MQADQGLALLGPVLEVMIGDIVGLAVEVVLLEDELKAATGR